MNVMEKENVRFFARAEGRVQGVGFRFFVQQNALELGLCGWVRNMEDGSVTMEVQGAAEAVADVLTVVPSLIRLTLGAGYAGGVCSRCDARVTGPGGAGQEGAAG